MKYVPVSSDIPALLQACKTRQPNPDNPTEAWQRFTKRKANRNQLRTALYARQDGLCAYCEIPLETDIGSHIDHILPKQKHPTMTFDYDNLVLSCFATGGEVKANQEDPVPVSCGHADLKRINNFDDSLFIKPTDADCEQYFSFELDGEVIAQFSLNSSDTEKAEHTLQVLNLNCLRLKRLREDIITLLYQIVNELQSDKNALERFLILELHKTKSFINARKQHFG